MKNKFLILLAATSLIFTGCATVFTGTTQTVHVKVIDSKTGQTLDNCNCMVVDGAGGSYSVNANPGCVVVSKGHGPLVVNCSKAGYKQLNTAVGDSFNAVTLVNVFFWPGFIVDAATGAMKKYPSCYVVSMEKVS